MRCKKHISDRSSSVGVCASCLRERLFTLVEAQARAQALAEEDRRKSDPHPPPLIFPRSVSPYICRRSDDSSWHHHQINDHRFYSTPQVGPTTTASAAATASTTGIRQKKKHSSKFSLLSNLFRSSRSEHNNHNTEQESEPEPIPDPRVSTISRASLSTSTSSPVSSTWYSSIIPGRRKKPSPSPSIPTRRPCRTRDRGMSPSCEDEDYDCKDAGSPSQTSGYLSEASPGWRKSTAAAAAQSSRRKGQSQNNRSVSGMAFCLSPLVRASPKSHRNQKDGSNGGTVGFSGEIGWVSNKPNLSTAASFCANRSRKLANFGRYNYNP